MKKICPLLFLFIAFFSIDSVSQNNILCDQLKIEAIRHSEQNQDQLVIEKLTRVINMNCSKKNHSYYNRGVSYENLGNYNLAILDYSKVIEQSDGDFLYDSFYNRAVLYNKTNRIDLAITDLSQAIAYNPSSDKAFYNRGNAYYKKGDKNKALNDFKSAISINPNYTKALFNLATVKYELNLNACNEYKKACELGHSRACYFYRQDCR